MIIDPLSLAVTGISTGLSLFGASQENKARQQEYLNQSAYQKATNQFAQWQSAQNAKFSNANAQQQFWASTVQHNQQLAYVHQLQTFELAKQSVQADVVRDTRAGAGAAFVANSQALSEQLQEAALQESVALQQYQWRALQARGSAQAMEAEGNSIDRLINNYAKQAGDYETIASINDGLRRNQFNRQQTAMVGQYLSQWNSQVFYEPTQYIEPMAPFAPLPSLLQPAGPSMTGAAPGGGSSALRIGTALVGGVGTYFSSAAGIKKAIEGN